MLSFFNWFFDFFRDFVAELFAIPLDSGFTIGVYIASVLIVLMVGRFLVGYWRDKTYSVGGDD